MIIDEGTAALVALVAVFVVTLDDGCLSVDDVQRMLVVQFIRQMTEAKYVGCCCWA